MGCPSRAALSQGRAMEAHGSTSRPMEGGMSRTGCPRCIKLRLSNKTKLRLSNKTPDALQPNAVNPILYQASCTWPRAGVWMINSEGVFSLFSTDIAVLMLSRHCCPRPDDMIPTRVEPFPEQLSLHRQIHDLDATGSNKIRRINIRPLTRSKDRTSHTGAAPKTAASSI